jgi:hypothetical protein
MRVLVRFVLAAEAGKLSAAGVADLGIAKSLRYLAYIIHYLMWSHGAGRDGFVPHALLPPSRPAPARPGDARGPSYPGPSRAALRNSTPLPGACTRERSSPASPRQPAASGAQRGPSTGAHSPRVVRPYPTPGIPRRPGASGPAVAALAGAATRKHIAVVPRIPGRQPACQGCQHQRRIGHASAIYQQVALSVTASV